MALAIKSMLKRENVQIWEGADSWEEAVSVAVTPLVDTGYVEDRYIQGIIDNVAEYGPYFVICPDLALLHARPEQGALKTQLAVTVMREPVYFKPEGPGVRLLVTLAATDANSHIDVMRELATMFSDPERIAQIVEAKTADEVYEDFIKDAE
jgi:PTS system ascorbate-specific IIA component